MTPEKTLDQIFRFHTSMVLARYSFTRAEFFVLWLSSTLSWHTSMPDRSALSLAGRLDPFTTCSSALARALARGWSKARHLSIPWATDGLFHSWAKKRTGRVP
jgi:hypothetical protein